jgi:UDP-N-acetylglucosamine 4,6-dehydratase
LIADGERELPITDERMTRFLITLSQGVDFVIRAFCRMKGGELFVPKIPSAKITDIARAVAPDLPFRIVGIRPGEKLHETMCPADDSHLALEFEDHFVIKPSINFRAIIDYEEDAEGGRGHPVAQGFEYNSGTNPRFLSAEEIRGICS